MKTKIQLVNSGEAWDANRRYKINAIVTYSGSDWQNTTGINSEPGIGNDWTRVSGNSQTLQEVSNNGGFDNGSTVKKGTTDAGNGGAKGVALKCSLDYEFKWEAGRLYIMQQDGFTIRDTLYNFNNTPTENDDDSKGFVIGSRWILDNGDIYLCGDATTGFAVWELDDIPTGVNNSTSVVLTSSYLNSNYPSAITGFKVYCTNITAGKMVYEKTPSGWIGYSCIIP